MVFISSMPAIDISSAMESVNLWSMVKIAIIGVHILDVSLMIMDGLTMVRVFVEVDGRLVINYDVVSFLLFSLHTISNGNHTFMAGYNYVVFLLFQLLIIIFHNTLMLQEVLSLIARYAAQMLCVGWHVCFKRALGMVIVMHLRWMSKMIVLDRSDVAVHDVFNVVG